MPTAKILKMLTGLSMEMKMVYLILDRNAINWWGSVNLLELYLRNLFLFGSDQAMYFLAIGEGKDYLWSGSWEFRPRSIRISTKQFYKS